MLPPCLLTLYPRLGLSVSAYCTYNSCSAHHDQDPRVREMEEAYRVYVETYNFLIPTILPLKGNIWFWVQGVFVCVRFHGAYFEKLFTVYFSGLKKWQLKLETPKLQDKELLWKAQALMWRPHRLPPTGEASPVFSNGWRPSQYPFWFMHTESHNNTCMQWCRQSRHTYYIFPMNSTGSKKLCLGSSSWSVVFNNYYYI